jgi:hypothetical protein
MSGRHRLPPRARTTRWALFRDTATIVGGGLLAIAAFQLLSGGTPGASPGFSVPPDQTGVVVGSLDVGPTQPPAVTLGPVVNPSVNIEATPTPVPVITLPPRR